MKLISILQDLIAPRARAEISFVIKGTIEGFLASLEKEHRLLSSGALVTKFRVKGDSFSGLGAAKILVGKKANPKDYANVGFFLEVLPQEPNMVILRAEERVIFGYLETKAVGVALGEMLKKLVEGHD